MEKRLVPYRRTTRGNPAGHFWFTKIPAGRYYVLSLIEEGSGAHKEEQLAGLAWLILELDANEKLTNLVAPTAKPVSTKFAFLKPRAETGESEGRFPK